jgi:hypothetical protein
MALNTQAQRRERLLNLISDSVSDLLYYDRKDADEEDGMPLGVIEKMIEDGEITRDEMAAHFRQCLDNP